MNIKKDNIFKNNYKLKLIVISFLMITVSGLVSYGAYVTIKGQSGENIISSSCFSTSFEEGTSISLSKAMPLSDTEGLLLEPYTFSITNTCDLEATYYIVLNSKKGSFDDSYINGSINNTNIFTLSKTTTNNRFDIEPEYNSSHIIASGKIKKGDTASKELKLWINESASYEAGMSWEGQIKIFSVVAEHDTLLLTKSDYMPEFGIDNSNANSPNLVDNLIPVVYDETTDQWIKASTIQNNWYNYNKQIWANAVTTTNKTREAYNAAEVGTIINMDDILGMYVWIPRFEYKFTDLSTAYSGGTMDQPGEIKINFVKNLSLTENSNYIIHPSFRNGSITYKNNAYETTAVYQMGGWDRELSGYWFAKFETAGTNNEPLIKPDEIALGGYKASELFDISKNISTQQGITLDSHMAKNSEWGAVSYLSQSRYGKYGSDDYEGLSKEIYINNSSDLYTGRSLGSPAGIEGYSEKEGTLRYNESTKITKELWSKLTYENGITITNSPTYPWSLTNGVYKSTNQGMHNSTTSFKIVFTLSETTTLTFDWAVSSENASSDYLYYTIIKNGTTMSETGTSTKIGGLNMGNSDSSMNYDTITKVLETGTYELSFTYQKNGSVNSGSDSAYIKNINLVQGINYTGSDIQTYKGGGLGASTTGNIYGIYDMVGGISEYTMGIYNTTGLPTNELKYYDLYTSNNISKACYDLICYGHGLKEMQNWYNDQIELPNVTYPWTLRGGSQSDAQTKLSGIFKSSQVNDLKAQNRGFRTVLT